MNQQKCILVVEDEIAVQQSLKYILTKNHYRAVFACNGMEALSFLRANQDTVDLIISDIEMPMMNGVEFLKNLHIRNRYIPTLIITGYGDRKLMKELLHIGCEDFLDKPFTKQELLDSIQGIFNNYNKGSKSLDQKKIQHLESDLNKVSCTYQNFNNAATDHFHYDVWGQSMDAIGGDCFYLHEENDVVFGLLADVAGHDMGASYYTVILKTLFEDTFLASQSPEYLFQKVGEILPEIDQSKRMICALCFRFHKKTGVLEAVSAGSPKLILQQSDGSIREFPQQVFPPLGIYPIEGLVSQECVIEDTARIILTTDGVVNAAPPMREEKEKHRFGMERLKEITNEHSVSSPKQLLGAVKNEVLQFCRNKREDDFMVVCVDLERGQDV